MAMKYQIILPYEEYDSITWDIVQWCEKFGIDGNHWHWAGLPRIHKKQDFRFNKESDALWFWIVWR